MTFGMTLGEQLTMAATADMFYIAIIYQNKTNMKVAASNIYIKIHQVSRDHSTTEDFSGLDTKLRLNNVQTYM